MLREKLEKLRMVITRFKGMPPTANSWERAYNKCLDDVFLLLNKHLGELRVEEEIDFGDRQKIQRLKGKIWTEYNWVKKKPGRTVHISVYVKRKEEF